MHQKHFNIDSKLVEMAREIESSITGILNQIDYNSEFNQFKLIKAMQDQKISEAHFIGTTGYGYDDMGREAIDSVFSQIFHAEDALVRTQFVSGTHAINVALWSILRPGDTLLSVTGKPYDTLEEAIGITGNSTGSLKDFGVNYKEIPLNCNGQIDYGLIRDTICKQSVKMIYIQRSKGYGWRPSLCIAEINNLIKFIKDINKNIICLIDNCYGEFVEVQEPTEVGADLVVGSLIKNPGGGLAQTGAYIIGKSDLVKMASYRLTSPGIGKKCGATLGTNRSILMGLFLAPHVVSQSLKGAVFCAALMEKLGFEVSPAPEEARTDIIQAIKFGHKDLLISFCQGIQKGAAVDSHVSPQPWDMPGYNSQVIMAAGTFIQGASIEMSADAPIKPPYIAYVQGGLTYTHAKLSILMAVQELIDKKLL